MIGVASDPILLKELIISIIGLYLLLKLKFADNHSLLTFFDLCLVNRHRNHNNSNSRGKPHSYCVLLLLIVIAIWKRNTNVLDNVRYTRQKKEDVLIANIFREIDLWTKLFETKINFTIQILQHCLSLGFIFHIFMYWPMIENGTYWISRKSDRFLVLWCLKNL